MKNLFLVPVFFLTLFVSCTKSESVSPLQFSCMDTICTVNAYDDGSRKLYSEIRERLEQIDRTFSISNSSSDISRINRLSKSESLEISSDTSYVLQAALKTAEISDGAFNPAMEELISLWNINSDNPKVPERDQIQKALSCSDWKKIRVNGNTVQVDSDSVKINLGGIAKGFAADEIVEILKANKVKKAVIDLGGNIYVFGKKNNNLKWTVGAKDPEEPDGDPLVKIKTSETSVVSSGTYERYFIEDSVRYHHIFDPSTGYPADKNLTQVTVISKKSIVADVLSTTAFVLGKNRTLELLDEFQKEFDTKIDFIFVEKGNIVSWTKNPDIEILAQSRSPCINEGGINH